MDLARGRRVASRTNQIVRALQGSMDSLTHDAYLERRELAWRTAGVVPDGAYSMVVLDGACGTRGSLWSVTGVGACAWCTAWRHQGMQRYAINSGRGPHTLLGEHFEWEGLINCLKDCLRRCTGLGASQGAVQGASRLWAAEGRSVRWMGRVQHYIVASDCLVRCTGLGASQGAVQGARVD